MIDDIILDTTTGDIDFDAELETFVTDNETKLNTAVSNMLNDPELEDQINDVVGDIGFTKAELDGKTFHIDGGPVVSLNADGTGVNKEVSREWDEVNQQEVVNYSEDQFT